MKIHKGRDTFPGIPSPKKMSTKNYYLTHTRRSSCRLRLHPLSSICSVTVSGESVTVSLRVSQISCEENLPLSASWRKASRTVFSCFSILRVL